MSNQQRDTSETSVSLPLALIERLGAARSIQELLDVTACWVEDVVECDRLSISVLSDAGDKLKLLAVGDKTVMTPDTTFEFDTSLVGIAFTEQRVINLADLAHSDLTDMSALWQLGIGSVLVAPLVTAGQGLGTINVGRFDGRPFSGEDETKIRSMTGLLAAYLAAHRQVEQVRTVARIDHLTGLLNRRAILEVLAESIENRNDTAVSVLFLDLDGFKRVNDAHGHATGDALLVEISRRMSAAVREGDTVGRLGGDEFLAICRSADDAEPAEAIARRLVDDCAEPVHIGPAVIKPVVSVGVTSLNQSTRSTEDLLAEADYAMYHAKRSADSIAVFDDRIRAEADLLAAVDRDLPLAIANGEMEFYYQAVESLNSAGVLGAEALLRWEHPEHGLIPPPLVLERVESSGLIEQFTQWSLSQLGRDWAGLQKAAPSFAAKAVSINLNPSQLGLSRYCQWHMNMIKANGLAANDVVVEVVESGFEQLCEAASATLHQLAKEGVTLALDDFGDSYNAISLFTQFPIHAVKFDHSLTRAMTDNSQVRTLVAGMADVATTLGIVVVAEGVENQEQVDALLAMGVDSAQGMFLSPPMSITEFTKVARRNEAYEATLLAIQ